ncbi:MAG: hypothetical protein WBM38_02725 [Arenicellales bacterium]|jgi:hypothetical protein
MKGEKRITIQSKIKKDQSSNIKGEKQAKCASTINKNKTTSPIRANNLSRAPAQKGKNSRLL